MDGDYPVFDESTAQRIPEPAKPKIINPDPGCFGLGAGALKTRAGTLSLNTETLVSYDQVYEVMVVIEKDTRRAKVCSQGPDMRQYKGMSLDTYVGEIVSHEQ